MSDLGGERREAAAVAGDLHAVDPDRGVVVAGLEVEEDARLVPARGDRDLAAVPGGVEEVGVLDARELRLRAERHDDARGQFAIQQAAVNAAVAGVDFKLPLAVEAEPFRTDELRAGVFGTGRRMHGVEVWECVSA